MPALANSDFYRPLWEALTNAVREGTPRWQEAFGASAEKVFAAAFSDPDRAKEIAAFFSAVSVPQGIALARSWDFSQAAKLLDVGGGGGSITIEILKANPHLHGTIVDLPPMVAAAQQNIAANGLSDRCTAVVGDIFESLPSGYDAALLAWVLHDWSDANCHKILRTCHNALPAGGRLFICEAVLNDDGTGSDHAVLGSLNMLVNAEPGARERTLREYRELLAATGFRLDELVQTGGARDLIVATRT
ncbi:MAG: methyltransferase [Acidobacteriota bacterium]